MFAYSCNRLRCGFKHFLLDHTHRFTGTHVKKYLLSKTVVVHFILLQTHTENFLAILKSFPFLQTVLSVSLLMTFIRSGTPTTLRICRCWLLYHVLQLKCSYMKTGLCLILQPG